MNKFLTLNQAINKARLIYPQWIAVNADGHICGHVDEPQLGIVAGNWISKGKTWDLGFYKKREEWKSTLRNIENL